MSRRLFVALLPPESVRDDLTRFLEPRWEAETPWRWTRPETWHITLAFLPAVSDARLEPLVGSLADVRTAAVPLALDGGLAFPDALRARVLGLRVGPDAERIARLAGTVRRACNRAGVEVDGTRFRAHLTLARTSRPHAAGLWIDLLDTFRSEPWVGTEVALVESHLGEGPRGAPRYEIVGTFGLDAPTR